MYCGQMGIDYIVDYLQINFKNLGGFNECLLQQKLLKNMPKTLQYYVAVQKQAK
jgi:hypothetical protein